MIRAGLICDFLEEQWPSMDLVGDMLYSELAACEDPEFHIDRIRPPFHRRLSAIPWLPHDSVWNADRLMNRHFDYPRLIRRSASRYDLFHVVDHSYAHLVHDLPAERTIVTCHDLDAFRCLLQPDKEPRPRWFRAMAARGLRGLRRAAHIVFGSHAVREEAARYRLVDERRVSVILNGVAPGFGMADDPVADAEAERLVSASPGHTLLLNVGSTISRKRIDLLLVLFASLRKRIPSAKLVRVGGPLTPAQVTLADTLGVFDGIITLPFLDRRVLAALYRRCNVLLQTSEAEGFGLPVIEAMTCGCPVVATDLPVTREIASNAALYCALGNTSEWTDTVLRLLEHQAAGSGHWKQHQSSLQERALHFNWKESASQFLAVYRQVLEKA